MPTLMPNQCSGDQRPQAMLGPCWKMGWQTPVVVHRLKEMMIHFSSFRAMAKVHTCARFVYLWEWSRGKQIFFQQHCFISLTLFFSFSFMKKITIDFLIYILFLIYICFICNSSIGSFIYDTIFTDIYVSESPM